MTSFITAFRQDFLAIRWALGSWVIGLVVLQQLTNQSAAESRLGTYAIVFTLFTLVVSGFTIFTRIVFNHPPVDDRGAWRTRPFKGSFIGIEKLVTCSVAILGPLLWFGWSSRLNGFHSRLFNFSADTFTSPHLLVPAMIIALYVASLCRSTKTLAITGMALGSLVVVGGYLHHWVLLRLALLTYSATGLWLAKVILCVGLGTLMIRQYVRQNTTVHAFAGVAVLLAVGLVSLAMPNPHRTIPVLFASGESVQVESVTVFPADQSPPAHPFAAQDAYWREQGHPPRIATPMIARVRLDGFDPGHLWRLHSWNFNSSGRGHRYWPPSLVGAGLFPLSTVANQIGLQGYRFQEGENTSMNIVFERLSHDDAPSVPPPARVFHFSVQRLKLRRVGEAPLHVDRSSLHATNTGLEILQIDPDQGWFVARFSNPDFENRRITLGWDRATEPLLVAVNDATQDATIVRPLPPTMAELRARTPDSPQRFTLPNLPGDIRIIAIIGDVTGALYLPSSVAKPSD